MSEPPFAAPAATATTTTTVPTTSRTSPAGALGAPDSPHRRGPKPWQALAGGRLRSSWEGLSLRWKILVPFLSLLSVCWIIGLVVLGLSLGQTVRNEARATVHQLADAATARLQREADAVAEQLKATVDEANLLISTEKMRQLLSAVSTSSLATFLLPVGGAVHADLVKLAAPDGRTVLDLRGNADDRGALADATLLATAPANVSTAAAVLTQDGGRVFLVAYNAVTVEGDLLATVMLGHRVDRELLQSIGAGPNSGLLVVGPKGVVASTMPGSDTAAWSKALLRPTSGTVTIRGHEYLIDQVPLRISGRSTSLTAVATLSTAPMNGSIVAGWTRSAIIFAAGTIAVIFFGFVVARGLTRPVTSLTEAAVRLAGGDLQARAHVSGRDEIGTLCATFNTMGEELAARDRRLGEALTEVTRISRTDSLTGLANHGAIHELLAAELDRCRRYGRPFCIVVMDMDDFKLLNDAHGHPAGDDVLRMVATRLREQCRVTDIVGRTGGDEFLIIMPETRPDQAIAVTERLREALAKRPFAAPDGTHIPVRLSFGIAVHDGGDTHANELIAEADANLYASKRRGGDTITSGAEADSDETVGAFGMLDSLVTAVDNKDRYTRRHSEEVTRHALDLAVALGLSEDSQRIVRVAGLLHDVGKIGVPDRILRKPGKLTVDEFEIVKQHAGLGEMIINAIPDLEEIRTAVVSHHERFDGRGYPNLLKGTEIPTFGRILAVADAFSAMTTDRTYRKAMTEDEALEELRAGAATQFDPELAGLFIRMRRAARAKEAQTLTV
jgi:diguanylate cyclase (GGDEF)-like protein